MIYISNDFEGDSVINLTVGDDAELLVPLKTDDGKEYTMTENEWLIFSVREKATEESPLLVEILSEHGSNEIIFTHNDTAELTPGYYSAEIQLMAEGGKRITVWPKMVGSEKIRPINRKNFCLMTEVVYR